MTRTGASRTARDVYVLHPLFERRVRVWLVATVLGSILIFRVAQVLVAAEQLPWGFDFSAYWLAGRHILEGVSIYTQDQLVGPYPPQSHFLYLYPPAFAVAVTPFSALFANYRDAAWLWAGSGTVLLIGTVVSVARAEGFVRLRDLALLVAAAFCLAPVVFELIMGNVHILLMALLAVAWLGVRRESPRGEILAGVTVGIAAVIKIFPGLLILWFLLTGRWRAAGGAVGAAAIVVLLTVPITGIDPWLDYPTVLANAAAPTPGTTVSPIGWLTDVVGFHGARLVVTIIGAGIVVYSIRSRPIPISFAITVMVSILVVPTLYPHYLAVAVLPLLLSLAHVRLVVWPLAAYVLLFVGGQVALLDLTSPEFRAVATVGAIAPLAVLLLPQQFAGEAQPASTSGVARHPRTQRST